MLQPKKVKYRRPQKGVSYEIAKEALRLAAQKLPVTTKFVVRRDYDESQNV